MSLPHFFSPIPLPERGPVELPAELAHHLVRVLRLHDGDALTLFDGSGHEVSGNLQLQAKMASVMVTQRRLVSRESPLQLVLVQALSTGDKMDWLVQKAVELGVSAIIPIISARCVLRLEGARAAKRVAHWQRVAIAACEQSGRNQIPLVSPILRLSDYLAEPPPPRRWILDPGEGASIRTLEKPLQPLHILIGPEGGWDDQERQACLGAGCCNTVCLGRRVLRTETAGLAVLAALQTLWGDY